MGGRGVEAPRISSRPAACFVHSAFAQDAPVADCDRYAASDLDPQRKATGVPFANVNPALAVPACEAAVRQYPNSTRLIFQLGRADQKANNFTAALEQYRKAAQQGSAAAQSNLGVMYENGYGVPQDYAQAVAWYRKAAGQGSAAGQNNLGVMYEMGKGVSKEVQQAVSWYGKAADQGFAPAQANFARLSQAAAQKESPTPSANNQPMPMGRDPGYSLAPNADDARIKNYVRGSIVTVPDTFEFDLSNHNRESVQLDSDLKAVLTPEHYWQFRTNHQFDLSQLSDEEYNKLGKVNAIFAAQLIRNPQQRSSAVRTAGELPPAPTAARSEANPDPPGVLRAQDQSRFYSELRNLHQQYAAISNDQSLTSIKRQLSSER